MFIVHETVYQIVLIMCTPAYLKIVFVEIFNVLFAIFTYSKMTVKEKCSVCQTKTLQKLFSIFVLLIKFSVDRVNFIILLFS